LCVYVLWTIQLCIWNNEWLCMTDDRVDANPTQINHEQFTGWQMAQPLTQCTALPSFHLSNTSVVSSFGQHGGETITSLPILASCSIYKSPFCLHCSTCYTYHFSNCRFHISTPVNHLHTSCQMLVHPESAPVGY
jgi:hypothetical protein